jgi:DNA-nicking Smr family endonuclease
MTRRPRGPTSEELALWGKVAETVAPIARPRKAKAEPQPEDKPVAPSKATRPKPPPATAPYVPPQSLPAKGPPALAPLDKRTRSRLSRGVVAIDRRIDLHGLTQTAAEARLQRFLRAAQEEGARVVLVITGKGSDGGQERGERGVLRRMTPHWLASPDMREVVVGFEEAARGHGGSGALYVRIRRAR